MQDKKKNILRLFRDFLLLIVLIIPPVMIIIRHYSIEHSFLSMIYFGREFKANRLEEVNNVNPPTLSKMGYDGQFYAQIALDPFLIRNDLERALDDPAYRSRRIGLPLLAFCLGLGEPGWILQVYALLNVALWLLLLTALGRFIGYQNLKDVLLAIALLWSTGTLVSVARALPDLPAAVLGVLAIFLHQNWITAAFLLGGSALFKETAALSFIAIQYRDKRGGKGIKRIIISALIMLLPITLWVVYVQARMTTGSLGGSNNFAFPLSGFVQKLWETSHGFWRGFPQNSVSRQVVFRVRNPLPPVSGGSGDVFVRKTAL